MKKHLKLSTSLSVLLRGHIEFFFNSNVQSHLNCANKVLLSTICESELIQEVFTSIDFS